MKLKSLLTSLSVALFCAIAQAQNEPPLVAHYAMEPDAQNAKQLTDSGPLKLNGAVGNGARFVPGKIGQALEFTREGDSRARVNKVGLIGRLSDKITVTAWVKIEDYKDAGGIIAKRADNVATPFSLSIGKEGQMGFEGNNGQGWDNLFTGPNVVPKGQWFHLAFVYEAGNEARFYVNGKQVGARKVSRALASNDQDFVLGADPFRGGFKGALDEVKLFAAALSAEQIQSEVNGQNLPTRAAKNEDFSEPTHLVKFALVRFDEPIGFQEGYGRTRQTAHKVAAPNAVDWPQITLDGKPILADAGEQNIDLPLRENGKERPLFQQPYDQVVQPGNHWLRAVQWMWGQRYAYTTDRTARTWMTDYELWTFPILIQSEGEDVRDVLLKYDGKTIYQNAAALHSLTLLLPQSEAGKKYQLSVAGRAPIAFEAGLLPIQIGDPQNNVIPINFTLPGAPPITVKNAPPAFANQKAWDEDLAAMRAVMLPKAPQDVLAARLKNIAFNDNGVPLLAYFPMEPNLKNPAQFLDFGPSQFDGALQDGATYDGNGKRDNALRFNGAASRAMVEKAPPLTSPDGAFTFSIWLRPEELPRPDTVAYIVSTRRSWHATKPWSLRLAPDGNWGFEGHDGEWKQHWADAKLQTGKWQHLAFSFAPGGDMVFYLDGKEVKRAKASKQLTPGTQPLVFGYEEGGDFPGGGRSGFKGLLDEAKFYGAALDATQIAADMNNTLPLRLPEGVTLKVRAISAAPVLQARLEEGASPAKVAPPISIYAINPPHGMGGGAFYFGGEHLKKFDGSAMQYADYLANLGLDSVWEKQWNDEYARALGAKGVQFGYIPGTSWGRPFMAHPNVAFFAATLPDWHEPIYRQLQLDAEYLKPYSNFAGLATGADNGGYVSFWDWAPPIPNRPWGEAFQQFQTPLNPPLARGDKGGSDVPLPKHLGGKASVKEFVDYIARYDETYKQYGYFGQAVREVDPKLKFFTGSFGSSPGVGARGGWPWASIPAKPMHENLDIMQAYDWNELSSSKPMHLPALIDRLKSYYPQKTAWGLVDDFKLFFGRQARQRAYALALTRGIEAIGTTFLAAPTGDQAKPQTIAEQKELFAWIHKYGGIYKGTRPLASVGVLYVHPQALLRRVNQDYNANDEALLRGSHEGKTTEALWLCHAAGWPAKIVTPEEVQRGFAPEMKVLLLTGLNRFDDSWAWSDGLETQLKNFVARGGKIILDDESVVPNGIAATKTDLKIRSYVTQSDTDWTPKLFARNKENIQLLRAAFQGVEQPIVTSDNPTIWAIPHQTGDVIYVTVVNWGYDENKNASEFVKPQTGTLKWNSTRPIFDVATGKKLTMQEAQTVDLTKDGFAVFALPPAEPKEVRLHWPGGIERFLRADVLSAEGKVFKGLPMQMNVQYGAKSRSQFFASGDTMSWPLSLEKAHISVMDLASGIKHEQDEPSIAILGSEFGSPSLLDSFAHRSNASLIIALTPEQQANPQIKRLAEKLATYFEKTRNQPWAPRGKGIGIMIGSNAKPIEQAVVSIRTLAPGEVIRSLQPLNLIRFPQWQTVDADLILLGNAQNNILMFDQMRGGLLKETAPNATVTFSPFVGQQQVLNIVADDADGLEKAVAQITR